jgi:hypothetical protein
MKYEKDILDTMIDEFDNYFIGAIEFKNKQNSYIRAECSRLLEKIDDNNLSRDEMLSEIREEFNKMKMLLEDELQKKLKQDSDFLMRMESLKSELTLMQLQRINEHELELRTKMKKIIGYKNLDLVNFDKIIKNKIKQLNRKKCWFF